MTVYIVWKKKKRAIRCPECNRCNQVSAQKEGNILRCSNCNSDFKFLRKEIKLRNIERRRIKGEKLKWKIKK